MGRRPTYWGSFRIRLLPAVLPTLDARFIRRSNPLCCCRQRSFFLCPFFHRAVASYRITALNYATACSSPPGRQRHEAGDGAVPSELLECEKLPLGCW